MLATRNSWKIQPTPREREHFHLPLVFSRTEAERLRLGHIPEDMDDKWFIFFEDGWLYFHRSWTGDCIYGIQLDEEDGGVRIIDCWASRDGERYRSPGIEDERDIIRQVIEIKLLH